jgi:hypothetical protein
MKEVQATMVDLNRTGARRLNEGVNREATGAWPLRHTFILQAAHLVVFSLLLCYGQVSGRQAQHV